MVLPPVVVCGRPAYTQIVRRASDDVGVAIEDITNKAALKRFIEGELGTIPARLEQLVGMLSGQLKIPFPFGANWSNFGGVKEDASYSKVGRVVYLQGLVTKSGTPAAGDVIGTLPAGFRPTENLHFAAASGAESPGAVSLTAGRVDVASSGNVVWVTGSTVETDVISLSGISFVID